MIKFELSEVRKVSLEKGYEFSDKTYEGINYRHSFKCPVHNQIEKVSYKSVKRGRKLSCCKVKKSDKYTENFVSEKLNLMGLKLVDEYKGISKKHFVKCLRHHKVSWINMAKVIKEKKHPPCCSKESTSKKESTTRPPQEWKDNIKKASDYTCRVCRKKNLTGKNCSTICFDIFTDSEDLTTGVCLCSLCKVEFHKKYGFKKNTKEQYEEFHYLNCKKPQTLFNPVLLRPVLRDKNKDDKIIKP